jgi:hypothetical protein
MAVDVTILALLLPPIVVGLLVSLLIEQAITPKPLPIGRRSFFTLPLHSGVWLVLFAIGLMLCQRPWFMVVLLWIFQALLVLVNQAKYDSLREAFIFQDFEYFTDAIKHPRLYLPFFGVARTFFATMGFIGAVGIGILLEPPLTDTVTWIVLDLLGVAILVLGLLLCAWGHKKAPVATENPNDDIRALGQITLFWRYWQAERFSKVDLSATPFKNLPKHTPGLDLADMVVIQSESFFDPRSLFDGINPNVLAHFDQIKTESCQHGRLQVPAWGANTVRTECAFLTGLSAGQMGIHRFNPYRTLAGQNIPNLVSFLKQAGYRTVCIHPYHASFYLRDKVFPRLGFDEFIDLGHFSDGQKCGQYIGDLAVADKIQSLLDAGRDQPLFIFAITMENHGPLHLEQPDAAQQSQLFNTPPPADCNDLRVYLQHLKNADLMINQLKSCLQAHHRAGVLCWYGDHVPIMPSVYQRFGEPLAVTDYFVWRTTGENPYDLQDSKELAAHELAFLALKQAGFLLN